MSDLKPKRKTKNVIQEIPSKYYATVYIDFNKSRLIVEDFSEITVNFVICSTVYLVMSQEVLNKIIAYLREITRIYLNELKQTTDKAYYYHPAIDLELINIISKKLKEQECFGFLSDTDIDTIKALHPDLFILLPKQDLFVKRNLNDFH